MVLATLKLLNGLLIELLGALSYVLIKIEILPMRKTILLRKLLQRYIYIKVNQRKNFLKNDDDTRTRL